MKYELSHQQLQLENNSTIDLYTLDQGISVAFNRIYTNNVEKGSSKYYDLTINFCIKGRCNVALQNGKNAILDKNYLSISTSEPNNNFYFPGNLYEGIQIYIDPGASAIVHNDDFLSMMAIPPSQFIQTFGKKNNGLYIAMASDEMLPIIKSIWDMRNNPDIPMIRFLLVSLFHKMFLLPKKSENITLYPKSQIAIVKEAESIILSDLSKKHSAKEMAQYFGVSESSFKLYVKGILGESYLHYFRHKRMEKASELLTTTNLKVIDIANSVGYDNQGKFAKVFADTYGVSPLEYRRNISFHREGTDYSQLF